MVARQSTTIRIALMAIAGILSACDGPDPGVDGGHFDGQVRDAEMPDASCPLGQLGCECDEGACESGACVMGMCTECGIGTESCACRSDGTCSAGLRCEAGSEICVVCSPGEEGCACGSGCGEGLVCELGICVQDTCTEGAVGCPCAADGSGCAAGAFCDGTLCQACTADVPGCPCEGGACSGGLICEAGLCRPALSCADLRAAGTCGEHERCEQVAGADATCLTGTCVDGYRWSALSERCVACVSVDCASEPTCVPDQPTSLDCGAHRVCVQSGDVGECGGCEAGYLDVGGDCVEVDTCGGVICAADEYCDTTSSSGPTCTAWPCSDPSTVVGTDGTCSVTCTRSCAVPGSTGRYWPFAASDDSCICETLPGWYFDAGGESEPVECDADDDGWVREEVRDLHDAAEPDPALIANARCAIRQAGAVKLVDEYGIASVIDSCEEGLLQDRTSASCTVFPLRLFEIKRNDVEGEAARLGEAPPYASGGRRFRAAELNSLTKACVTALGDYDGDGFEDISQFQPRPSDTTTLGEEARLRSFAHFVELYQTYWERPVAPSPYGTLVIRERARCGSLPLGYGPDTAYDPANGATYWRSCARLRHPDFQADSSDPGFDFAQWSCDARSGTCPAPAMPAHRDEASFPDPGVALLRNHGLCELGGRPPADGVWRGMGHHSQFQCVLVVADGTAAASYERERTSFGAAGSLVFNACTVTDCAGDPTCSDSTPPVRTPDPHNPRISCAHSVGFVPTEGVVGWAALRYQPYGHIGLSGELEDDLTYAGGCINEDAEYPDLCPVPEFGRCPTADTGSFGRYHCYGWDSLYLWADDDAIQRRAELEWAPETGEATNMSIFNPASAPVCM